MNVLHTLLFIIFVPYVQIFFINPLFPSGSFIAAPSLFVASAALFALRKDYVCSYTYAFLSGIAASFILAHPAGACAGSYLIIALSVRKFSGNFDMSGILGRFILGFAASLLNYFYFFLLGTFLSVSLPSFTAALFSSVLTGLLFVLMFSVFFTKHKSVI